MKMCQYTVVFGYNTVCASVCSLLGKKNERLTAHKSHLNTKVRFLNSIFCVTFLCES